MPTVLILGAGSDMAIAVAEKFASDGYDIQLAARKVDRLSALQADLAIRFSSRVGLSEFDAVNFSTHEAFFRELNPKPDITVCVFGYLGDNDKAVDDWKESERIINTNYTGAVSVLNIIAAYYSSVKQGIIVGISSVAGERGRQSNYMYGSAKAGFTAYLSGLRNRMTRFGVHVVTVKPGFVFTKMTEELSLPPLLTAKPELVAAVIYKAVKAKKNVVYVKWFWRWIMFLIKSIPEFIFKKMKL